MFESDQYRLLGTILLVVLLVPSAISDIRTRKIPNKFTIPAMIVALGIRSFFGIEPFVLGLAGGLIAFAFSFPLFAIKALGGGDGKLLIAVGLIMGPKQFLISLVIVAICGGVLSFAESARQGKLKDTLTSCKMLLWGWFFTWRATGSIFSKQSIDNPASVTVPYGVAIAVGSLIGWFIKL